MACLSILGLPTQGWANQEGVDTPSASTPAEPNPEVVNHLRQRLEASSGKALWVAGEKTYAVVELPRFYEERAYRPAWHGPWRDAGPKLNLARAVVRALRESEQEGMRPGDYHLQALESLITRVETASAGSPEGAGGENLPALLADLDLLLTDAFLTYAAHLVSGRVNAATLDPEWHATQREVDVVAVLRRALEERQPRRVLRELRPDQNGYHRLLDALARYRQLEPWTPIPDGPLPLVDGPLVDGASEDGSSGDRRIEALRQRLLATGDLVAGDRALQSAGDSAVDSAATQVDAAASSAVSTVGSTVEGSSQTDAAKHVSDPLLLDAVRAFQRRHGLGDDGIIGAKTLEALNVPLEARIRQIELNLERWRWLPRELGDRHVLVDIPAFSLVVVEHDEVQLEMRVAVGRAYRRTPVMSDQIRYLVLNPYWEIPPNLAIQDKLPEIRKNRGYLAAQRIKVLRGWGSDERTIDPSTVDWSRLGRGNFPYRLRQDPGPKNSLGRVKFMFPNPFNVYLHDTPAHGVFASPERAVSSGCVRVEQPLELTEYLLRGAPGWDAAKIRATVEKGDTVTVNLPELVPVHLQYWTASVDPAGIVHFRQDIYNRDAPLAAALDARTPGGTT